MNQIQALYQKIAVDAELRQKLGKILSPAETESKEVTEKKLEAFAAEAGFAVTMNDLKAFLGEAKKTELSESELDAVAGGKNPYGDVVIIESILTLGLACAMASLEHAIQESPEACKDYFG